MVADNQLRQVGKKDFAGHPAVDLVLVLFLFSLVFPKYFQVNKH